MMKIELENVLPREIEKRSFELITEELGERTFSVFPKVLSKKQKKRSETEPAL